MNTSLVDLPHHTARCSEPRLVGNAEERLPGFPTQLPLEILRAIVGCASDPGDRVLDPFCGSGTTGVACVESGRLFSGIEKNPEYVEQARERLAGVLNGS
jgi:DNA modification methylase